MNRRREILIEETKRPAVTAGTVLRDTMGRRALQYVAAIACTAVATAFAFSVPLVVQLFMDSVYGPEPIAPFALLRAAVNSVGGLETLRVAPWYGAVAVLLLTAGNGSFSYLANRTAAEAAETGAERLRNILYRHLQRVSMSFYSGAATGDLTQRCTSDVETVRRFFAIQLAEVGRAVALVGLAIPVMARLNGRLTVVAVSSVPILFLFSFFFFRKVQEAFLESDEAEGDLSAMLQEHLSGIRVVRAFGRQAYEQDRFDRDNQEYYSVTYRLIRLLATYWTVSELVAMGQLAAVVIAGAILGINGTVTVGTLLVFWMLEIQILWPVRQMGRILADMGKAKVSLGRIAEVLAAPEEDEDPIAGPPGAARPEIAGGIVFDRVSFAYPGGDPVLDDVSFEVRPGQTIGLLGPTGSGKTSLMVLLARLYDYSSGSIRIDGTELREIDRRWLRQHIGYVLQEPFLYAKSLRDNIGMARHDAEDAEVFAATRAAAIHDVIEGFERGYDTPVGERGVTLSGGQKQRIAIARALLMDSPILVFDDSLSAVDTKTDARIREALLRRARGSGRFGQARPATTFIISHRVTTLIQADVVVVFDSGKVVQTGAPAELMEQEGPFRRVWMIQQGDEDASVSRANVY